MKNKLFWPVILAMVVSGCGSQKIFVERPEPRPLLKPFQAEEVEKRKTLPPQNPSGVLTLRDALRLALLRNPELKVYSLEIRAREAQALQASLWPNPEVEVEVENFGGRGATRGMQAAESTLLLSQLIELGGKRKKRTDVARFEGQLAAWDYEAQKLAVFTRVLQAYVDVLAAQEKVALQEELLEVGEKFLETIRQRVKAGRTSPAEAYRAEVELEFTRVELKKARQELRAARKRLVSLWGAREARFEKVAGNLEQLKPVPPLARLEALLEQNPELARWATERRLQQTVVALEKANRIPDPSIGLGYRQLNDEADQAFVVGLSLPLPVFDRNQGGIQEALLRQKQVEWNEKAVRTALSAELAEVYSNLTAARNEVEALRERILPGAQEAYNVIREGYQMGKFGFLDVLDAQRTLFEVRSRYIEALAEYHKQVAELERLVGQDISDLEQEK